MSDTNIIPQRVVDQDVKLRGSEQTSGRKLAELRWSWTIGADECGNVRLVSGKRGPTRTGFRSYAQAVGISDKVIRNYAIAWPILRDNPTTSVSDALARAQTSVAQAAAVEAVAAATGRSFAQVTKDRKGIDLARDVRISAERTAQRNGTSVADEAPRIAAHRVRLAEARQTAQREQTERADAIQRSAFLTPLQVDGQLAAARRVLRTVIRKDTAWELWQEDADTMANTLALLDDLSSQIDTLRLLVAGSGIDWDAVAADLGGGQ